MIAVESSPLPAPPTAGLLLTGGRSSRMGHDKATLRDASGRTWAERAGGLLASVAAPALEVGPGASGLLAVADNEPHGGPLMAVAAGWYRLRSLGSDLPTLVVACDMPRLTASALVLLARWPGESSVVPMLDGAPQWCCARYSFSCLRRVSELVADGRRDMRALADADPDLIRLGPEQLGCELETFADADTPEDLEALGVAFSAGAVPESLQVVPRLGELTRAGWETLVGPGLGPAGGLGTVPA